MSLTELLRTALRSVAANKLRAALTMLGIVIGVASVIAMLALGNGARAAVDATFKSLGANQIQIGQRFEMQDGEFAPTGKTLTYLDGLDMRANAPLVERVEMSVSKTLRARFGRASIEISAIGTPQLRPFFSRMTARLHVAGSSPHGNALPSGPRAAASHCASVGRRLPCARQY